VGLERASYVLVVNIKPPIGLKPIIIPLARDMTYCHPVAGKKISLLASRPAGDLPTEFFGFT